MDSITVKLLAEAIASTTDELTRRLLLNVLVAELEQLRAMSVRQATMKLIRGDGT